MNECDLVYFRRGETENQKFWSRLGGKPNLEGKICCDIGCGHGSLAIDMANTGASKVLGFDTDARRIEFAIQNLKLNFPTLVNKVEFHCADFRDIDMTFDIITSKDACEHIIYLREMLLSVKDKLNEGGLFFAGFGPLYNSIYGDHQKPTESIPWSHLIFPHTKEELYARGLNGLSFKEYKSIFYDSGLSVLQFKVNESRNVISKLFTLISYVDCLREYFSHNIYCCLKK